LEDDQLGFPSVPISREKLREENKRYRGRGSICRRSKKHLVQGELNTSSNNTITGASGINSHSSWAVKKAYLRAKREASRGSAVRLQKKKCLYIKGKRAHSGKSALFWYKRVEGPGRRKISHVKRGK